MDSLTSFNTKILNLLLQNPEADWILGIGKTHDITEEYMRHLALSKNKLTGDVDSDPDQRHGRQTVRICPTTARYEDIN